MGTLKSTLWALDQLAFVIIQKNIWPTQILVTKAMCWKLSHHPVIFEIGRAHV